MRSKVLRIETHNKDITCINPLESIIILESSFAQTIYCLIASKDDALQFLKTFPHEIVKEGRREKLRILFDVQISNHEMERHTCSFLHQNQIPVVQTDCH